MMHLTLLCIFFAGMGLIIHTYLVYPLVMIWRFRRRELTKNSGSFAQLPRVSILIAAYNEEKVIKEKIQSVLNGNYPQELITVYVGSDASSDLTDELVKELSVNYPNVHLHRFENREGKTGILNKLQHYIKDDFMILTDANVFFTTDTVSLLMAPFYEQRVGLVAANIIKTSEKNEGISLQEKKYLR